MAALVMAIAILVFVSTIAFATDGGKSSYAETPIAKMAITSEDVVSPLAATGSSVIDTITDADPRYRKQHCH